MNWTETTQAHFWEMLECLPPALMTSQGFLVGEPSDHRACCITGRIAPTFAAFAAIDSRHWEGGRFYECSQPLTVAEFRQVTRDEVLDLARP